MDRKTCIDCQEPKSLAEFYRRKRATGGYYSYCKECTRIRNSRYCEGNRSKVRATGRRYYAKNKRKALADVRLYRANHKEEYLSYLRRYRKTHSQEGLKYQHARRRTVKGRANTLLRQAVARGDIIKPSRCSSCGRYVAKRALHGHHDDYALPLVVRWLCPKCHGMARRME